MKIKTFVINVKEEYAVLQALSKTSIFNGVNANGVSNLSIGFKSLARTIGLTSAELGMFLAVAAGIITVVAVVNKLSESFDESVEKAEESRSAYEETKSEIESLESQLESTQDRIKELQSQGSLTLVEQEELAKLEATNQQLETQLAIKQKLAQYEGSQAAKDANDVLTKKDFTQYEDGSGYKNSFKNSVLHFGDGPDVSRTNVDVIEFTKGEQERLNELQEQYNSLLEEQSQYEPDSKEYKNLETRLKNINTEMTTLQSDISTNMTTINENIPSLYDDAGNVRKGYEETVKVYEELVDLILGKTEELKDKQGITESVLSRATLQDDVEAAKEYAEAMNGITLDDVIRYFPNLKAEVEAAGGSVDDLIALLNQMAGTIDADEVKRQLKDAFDTDSPTMNNVFDEWIDGLSLEDLKIVYGIYADNDTSAWTFADWKQALENAKTESDETSDEISSNFQEAFENITAEKDAVESAISEQAESGSISLDTYNGLIEQSAEYASCLENENGVITLNAEKARELAAAKQELQVKTLAELKAQDTAKYHENAEAIKNLTEADQAQIDMLEDENEQLLANINTYDLMIAELSEYVNAVDSSYNAVNDSVNNISSSMDIMSQAMSEVSENGAISGDTYEQLIALGSEYTDCLEWNGQALDVNEQKLSALKKTLNENAKAQIENAKAADIETWSKLSNEITEAQNNYENLSEEEKADLAVKEAQSKQLSENIQKYELLTQQLDYATSGYKAWLDAQSQSDSGEMHESGKSAYEALQEGFEEGRVGHGNTDFWGAAEFLIPQDVIDRGVGAMEYYAKSIEGLFDADKTGMEQVKTFLGWIEDADLGSWNEDGTFTINPDVTLDDLESGLHMTDDLILAMFGKTAEYIDGFEFVDKDSVSEAVQSLQGLIDAKAELNEKKTMYGEDSQEYAEALSNVKEYEDLIRSFPEETLTKLGVEIDPETEEILYNKEPIQADTEIDIETNVKSDVQQLIEDYRVACAELQKDPGNLEAANRVQELRNQLDTLPDETKAAFNIDPSLFDSGIASISETLNDYKVALQELDGLQVGDEGYDEAKQKVDDLRQTIENIPDLELNTNVDLDTLEEDLQSDDWELEINAPVNLDTESLDAEITDIETRIQNIQNTPIQIDADTSAADIAVDNLKSKVDSMDKTVHINANTSTGQENVSKLQTLIDAVKSKTIKMTATVIGQSALNTLKKTLDSIKSKSITVTTNYKKTGDTDVNGTAHVNGIAHSSGTAHANGTANASGDWGTKKGGKALVGELGQELMVDPNTGTWHTVGDYGAEIANVPKGAIIFNHKQTEALLKYGRVIGRGAAMVNGTAFTSGNFDDGHKAYLSGNALVTGVSGGGAFYTPKYYENKTSSGGSSKSTSSVSSSAVAATQSLEEALKDTLDEMKETMDDLIGDYEHQIFLLEKQGGSADEIVGIYQQMQDAVTAQIEEYRKLGLEDNSDYIQDLEEQWYEYADSIQETIVDAYEKVRSEQENAATLTENWRDNDIDTGDTQSLQRHTQEIIQYYKNAQDTIHQEAEYYRSLGYSDTSDEVSELSDAWYEYRDNIIEAMETAHEAVMGQYENSNTLNENWLDKAISSNDTSGIIKYTKNITDNYKGMMDEVHQQAEYYRSLGYSDTSDEVSELSDQWWQYYEEMKNVSAEAWQQVVDNASEAVDTITGLFDTMKNAAKDYAESGYITVDTFQQLCDLGVENLAYLEDENGQLVINEENINKVIAARVEQLAVETALSYIAKLRIASENNDIATLNNLTLATQNATNSTWGMVFAQLELLNLTDEQTAGAKKYINMLYSLTQTTIKGIGQVDSALQDTLNKQSDALDDLLKYVEQMIQQEIRNQTEALEDQADAYKDIVEYQKKSLQLEKEKNEYTKSVTEKEKEIAKIRQQLAMLELDDGRESLAKQAELREELAEKIDDLNELQADKAYDLTEEMLDDSVDAYEQSKNDEIEILNDTISSEEKLYRLA